MPIMRALPDAISMLKQPLVLNDGNVTVGKYDAGGFDGTVEWA